MSNEQTKPSTPELDKLNELHRSGEWDAVLSFVQDSPYVIAEWVPVEQGTLSQPRTKQLQALRQSPVRIVEQHFGLDGYQLDSEREALLKWASQQ